MSASLLEDETYELLTPSADFLPVLQALDQRVERWLVAPALATPGDWDSYAWLTFTRALGLFVAQRQGFNLERPLVEHDVLHWLSTELELMDANDLDQVFHHWVDGNPLSRHYRRIADAPQVRKLLENDSVMGWSGFSTQTLDREEAHRLRRQRMFVDTYRDVFNWTALRAFELSQAAALVCLASEIGMIDAIKAKPYARRLTVESSVRFSSWEAVAVSLLRASVFQRAGEDSEEQLKELAQDDERLHHYDQSVWQPLGWPQFGTLQVG